MTRAYEEIIDFIAGGNTPDTVAAFQPSEEARQRVADLLEQRKSISLSPDDEAELNHFLELEHIMRLAKARARKHIP
jgi:hypothetical protein